MSKKLRVIAHRGLIRGPDPDRENRPDQICDVLARGYDVEIDLRAVEKNGVTTLWLGHDHPTYMVPMDFITMRGLWVHCKDVETFSFMNSASNRVLDGDEVINYFYHTHEDVVLTSRGVPWSEPGKMLYHNGVCVLPETTSQDPQKAWGVCSKYAERYLRMNAELMENEE